MRRSALLLAALLLLGACGIDGTGTAVTSTTTDAAAATSAPSAPTTVDQPDYPVTIEADNGSVTLDDLPESIVSLSATATEILFAIGAGDQVVATDDQSNFPADVPTSDLSSFTPNVEAILSYDPDLVVIYYDPGDLVASLSAADVPVLSQPPATTLDDAYGQIEDLGKATGHAAEALGLNESIAEGLTMAIEAAPNIPEGTTYYHEVDNTFYTATSDTFIGQVYSMFGIENIADQTDDGSSLGYPQLSSEYIVSVDPDLIFLANALYGESVDTVAARPGWDVLSAVQGDNVVELDSDVVSRWGPRVVDFAEDVSDALEAYSSRN